MSCERFERIHINLYLMTKIIIQNRFFTTFEYSILDNKLNCKERSFGNEKEVNIIFENISSTKKTQKNSSILIIIGAFVSSLITISAIFLAESLRNALWGGFFWAFITVALFVYYFVSKTNLWVISLYDGGVIYFHKGIPNEIEVSNFIDELFNSRNNYLKERYSNIDRNLNYDDQFSKIEWLKNIEAISNNEYSELLEKLRLIADPAKKRVGFEK